MFETSVDKTWNYLAASILHTDTVPQFLQGLYHSFIYPSSMRWSARPTVSCALKTTRNELPDRFFSKKTFKIYTTPEVFQAKRKLVPAPAEVLKMTFTKTIGFYFIHHLFGTITSSQYNPLTMPCRNICLICLGLNYQSTRILPSLWSTI